MVTNKRLPQKSQQWSSLDVALSDLVDRLRASGYERILELEFRLWFTMDFDLNPDELLPRFREKGGVTVEESAEWGALENSDRWVKGGPTLRVVT